MKKMILIIGQTATGKSDLSIQIAKKFNAEIVSADSRQVYRGLNIGSGKITKKEMRGISHHLLDVCNPARRFTVAEYQKQAVNAIRGIISRGKVPIIVGGTGQYIDAVARGHVYPEVPPNPELRKQLESKSVSELFKTLKKLDPARARNIDPKNPRRLIRAIEIAESLGSIPPLRHSDILKNVRMSWIGIKAEPDELKRRISKRLDARIRLGMIAEAIRLHKKGLSWKRMTEFGLEYRYLALYLQGKISRKEMIEKLNYEIWHFAKRQMTWFKRNKSIKWYSPQDFKKIVRNIHSFLR